MIVTAPVSHTKEVNVLKPTNIIARDLNEAWFQVLSAATSKEYARTYKIDKGSFEKEQCRHQLHSLSLVIEYPETRPLAPYTEGSSLIPPTTDEYIEKYFAEYIMNDELFGNNEYTYGQFIYPHLYNIIEMLKETPFTNQAVINIGESLEECWYDGPIKMPKEYDAPPCLRTLTWQYDGEALHLYSFWRSWDLYSGLPSNLGALQLLNEYIAEETGYKTGQLIAYSSGAHVYTTKETMESIKTAIRRECI